MLTGIVGAAKEHLADVGAVGDDVSYRVRAPQRPALGAVALFVQPARDRGRAPEPGDVELEDLARDRRFGVVDDQIAGCAVVVVAEGSRAAVPAAFGGLLLHPGDHTLDQCGPFELGEDSEHLDHHPTRRRGGVERLGRRAKRDVSVVELFEDQGEASNRARQPVDPEHQEQVEAPFLRFGERALQARAFEHGAGHLVGVVAEGEPVVLGGDVGGEPVGLGFERVGLVLFVGGDTRVQANPQGGLGLRLLRHLTLARSLRPEGPSIAPRPRRFLPPSIPQMSAAGRGSPTVFLSGRSVTLGGVILKLTSVVVHWRGRVIHGRTPRI